MLYVYDDDESGELHDNVNDETPLFETKHWPGGSETANKSQEYQHELIQ